ncbi:MAG: hypothetical protein R3B59_09055 [Dehalococcoidia bacterium]
MPDSKKPTPTDEPSPYEKLRALAKRVMTAPEPPPSKPGGDGNRRSPA